MSEFDRLYKVNVLQPIGTRNERVLWRTVLKSVVANNGLAYNIITVFEARNFRLLVAFEYHLHLPMSELNTMNVMLLTLHIHIACVLTDRQRRKEGSGSTYPLIDLTSDHSSSGDWGSLSFSYWLFCDHLYRFSPHQYFSSSQTPLF